MGKKKQSSYQSDVFKEWNQKYRAYQKKKNAYIKSLIASANFSNQEQPSESPKNIEEEKYGSPQLYKAGQVQNINAKFKLKDYSWVFQLEEIIQIYMSIQSDIKSFNKPQHTKDLEDLIKALRLIRNFRHTPAYADISNSPAHVTQDKFQKAYGSMILSVGLIKREAKTLLDEISKTTGKKGGRSKGFSPIPAKNYLLYELLNFYQKTTGKPLSCNGKPYKFCDTESFLRFALNPQKMLNKVCGLKEPLYPFKNLTMQARRLISKIS